MSNARDDRRSGAGAATDIPWFAASDLTRMPVPPSPLPRAPTLLPFASAPHEDRGPMYALIASLGIVVVVLATLVIARPRATVIVEQPAASSDVDAPRHAR